MSNKFSCSLFKDSVYKCVKTASSYPCLPNFKLLHPEMKHTRDHTWRAQKKITNMDLQGFGEIESRASRWILKLLFYTWDIEGLRKDQQVLSWKRSKKALICLDGAADWPVWPCCWKQVNRNAAYYLSMWKEVIFYIWRRRKLVDVVLLCPRGWRRHYYFQQYTQHVLFWPSSKCCLK